MAFSYDPLDKANVNAQCAVAMCFVGDQLVKSDAQMCEDVTRLKFGP